MASVTEVSKIPSVKISLLFYRFIVSKSKLFQFVQINLMMFCFPILQHTKIIVRQSKHIWKANRESRLSKQCRGAHVILRWEVIGLK